jgi:hypothetical protein
MRRILCTLLLGMTLGTGVGCILPAYSALPNRRAEELLITSEDLRSMLDQWQRFWFLDMPDHMTPQRVHGGVI